MKSKKIFIVGILIIVLIFLAGCGSDQKEESNNELRKDQLENNTVDEIKSEDGSEAESETKESNLGTWAKYDEDIYFWKLDSGSREVSALFANYGEIAQHKNNLVKRGSDGKETTIANEAGAGKLYIFDNTIYYESRANNTTKICSIDLEGNNKKEYVDGYLKYIVGDYIYIQSPTDISVINKKDGQYKTIVKNATLMGVADSNVYYYTYPNDMSYINIGFINNDSDNGTVVSFNKSEYSEALSYYTPNVSFIDYKYQDGKVKVYVGDVQGTGYFVQEGWLIEMDADGKNVRKNITTTEDDTSESLVGSTDLIVDYKDKGLVYTDQNTGKETTIMTEEKVKSEFDFKYDDENIINVYSADLIGDELYIIIDNGVHNAAEDIGWRYSYKRTKTVAFKYNLKTAEIEQIYEL